MNLQKVKISALRHHPQNYNTHPESQIQELMASLDKFQQFKNIVVCRGQIIAGHGLVEAAKRKGMSEIYALIRDDLTPDEERALIIADNAIPSLAMPDPSALQDLLASIDTSFDIPGVTNEWLENLTAIFPEQENTEPTIDDENVADADEEKAFLHPLACFMGAFFIKSHTQIDVDVLKEWKKHPLSYPEFTDQMVNDFVKMWKKRKTFVEFLTVPPPSGKREHGYTDYPIEIVAKRVAESINIPYLQVFTPRFQRIRRGSGAKTHQEQEAFQFSSVPPFTVGLILDDVSTTRTTFSLVHQAFMAEQKTPFCVAWCSFR